MEQLDYAKAKKAFKQIKITKFGNIVISAKNAKDFRENTISYILYKKDNFYYWRRFIKLEYFDKRRAYQLFRQTKNYNYIWQKFDNIDDAIKRLKKYVQKFN